MSGKYAIELTADEEGLAREIGLLEHPPGSRDFDPNLVLELVSSLSERGAVPQIRRLYWSDPRYMTGGQKASHRDQFAKNNSTNEAIYTHPHFLPFLRYFIYGPDLPEHVISAFEDVVPKHVTSSDIIPICNEARKLAKELDLRRAPEEFFKLALEVGLDLYSAQMVRKKIVQAR